MGAARTEEISSIRRSRSRTKNDSGCTALKAVEGRAIDIPSECESRYPSCCRVSMNDFH